MKRVGLFVGIDKYKNGITSLKCACNDAKALSFAFNKADYEVELLLNEKGHCDTIIERVTEMISNLQQGDIFLFYFSGHGSEHNGTHYLLGPTAHATGALYRIGSLAIQDLVEITNIVPGLNRFFILDCCRANILADRDITYSCAATRDTSLARAVRQNNDINIIPPLILSSCSTGEVAFEDVKTGHGYFTNALLKSMKDENINSFQLFQNSLTITNTPKPQNVSWNGNISNWNKVLLFDRWKNILPAKVCETVSKSISKYDVIYLKKEIEKQINQFRVKVSDEISNLLEVAQQAEDDGEYSAAIRFLKLAQERLQETDNNEAAELYEIGERYFLGEGCIQSYEEAVKYFEKAAMQGNLDAQTALGICYESGYGVKEDLKTAVDWYFTAAEQGEPGAQCGLGRCYRWAENFKESIKWYFAAAEQGNPDAQAALGYYFFEGLGVEPDLKEAVKWYYAAAEQGHADAQMSLGYFYHEGIGVDKNLEEAVEWYYAAAEQGDGDAQYALGDLYEHGSGVEEDPEVAVMWYQKAANQDNAFAQNKLGICYEIGYGVAQNITLAVQWYKKAAKNGNNDAAYALERLRK